MGPIMIGLEENKKKYDVVKKFSESHGSQPVKESSDNKLKYILKGGRKE